MMNGWLAQDAPNSAGVFDMGRMSEETFEETKGASLSWKNYARGEERIGDQIEEYDYLNADGSPFMRVIRTSEKKFPLQRWDGKVWQWGAPKGRLPYNLPDVIAASEIYICEGEKDANAVTALGLVATTNCGGAGKWTSDLDQWFKPTHKVYVLADNDEPGRHHAQLIINHLAKIVGEIRIVELPGLTEKGDVSDWIATGGTKKKLLKLCAEAPLANIKLMEIDVIGGEIARAVDETQKYMLEAKRAVLVRGGMLVEPVWGKLPTHKGHETTVTIFKVMGVENLRYMINKHDIIYKKWIKTGREDKQITIDPPDKILMTLLKLGYWQFPKVSGIINAPTMRPDGSIVTEKGYDAVTHLWYWPDDQLNVPEIPEHPTKEDAEKALTLLKELFSGFAFQGDLDRSVALASLLGTVLRGAFDISPMTLFLAHMPGTGKSFLVDLISTIICGRPCPVIAASRNEEEMEKRIGSLLLESVPIISLDNMSFDLRSDVLCQMCTQQTIKIRILGKSETPSCEWRGMLFATGNNIRLVGDMARRGLICNLDAGVERPELREFNFNPFERVLKSQGAYLAACLTIARAYVVAEKKAKCSKIGGYSDWSKFVREPLVWLGEEDPVRSMEQAFNDDPNRVAAERLVELWSEILGNESSFRLNEVVEVAKKSEIGPNFGVGATDFVRIHPEFFDLLVERAGERNQIDPRKFGHWMRSLRGQIYNGFRVLVAAESSSNGHKWLVQKVPKKGV